MQQKNQSLGLYGHHVQARKATAAYILPHAPPAGKSVTVSFLLELLFVFMLVHFWGFTFSIVSLLPPAEITNNTQMKQNLATWSSGSKLWTQNWHIIPF